MRSEKQGIPGTKITRSTPPSGPEGQFPVRCPDHRPSWRREGNAAHPDPKCVLRAHGTKARRAALPGPAPHCGVIHAREAGPENRAVPCAPLGRSHGAPWRAGGNRHPGTPGAPHVWAVSPLPSPSSGCSDGGDGGGASESPVGLFTTPQPPPHTPVHSSGGRGRQSPYTQGEVARRWSFQKPYSFPLRAPPHKLCRGPRSLGAPRDSQTSGEVSPALRTSYAACSAHWTPKSQGCEYNHIKVREENLTHRGKAVKMLALKTGVNDVAPSRGMSAATRNWEKYREDSFRWASSGSVTL
ncbi:PREDICTED: uncharacterized protein LOC102029087 [Chinchilla lanigera]|uniref:uncharacterized protein LOC102029087 n=1 Tax=Chinchilla lanigera TaxID=34839 RepID=UPI00038EA8F8|nr:PREDICTED: uncharacterized protein LOC102029087 [Chinchilla lanigera]